MGQLDDSGRFLFKKFILGCVQLWSSGSSVPAYGLLSSYGAEAPFLLGKWDLPRPGIEPESPALPLNQWTTREVPLNDF